MRSGESSTIAKNCKLILSRVAGEVFVPTSDRDVFSDFVIDAVVLEVWCNLRSAVDYERRIFTLGNVYGW